MDFDEAAYPDDFDIAGVVYKGSRDRKKGEVQIPYTDPPLVRIGDVITQRNGPNEYQLKVMDADYQKDSSLEIGTEHPHILSLSVQNLATAALHPKPAPSVHIGKMSAKQVQIGDHNSLTVTVTLAEVVSKVAAGDDQEAKGLLKRLLENNTVAAVVGAGASALLGLL